MVSSYELSDLPSPSAFTPSPPSSPSRKSKPDLSINTSFPSSEQRLTSGNEELEGKGQAEPLPERLQRRRSSRGRKARARDTNILMGLGNSGERGYTQIPSSEESDYTTPTTLNSLDLDQDDEATSPSYSQHRSQTAYQKSTSRFRLRLLYTIVPVVSLALFALYTFIIIDHAQKNLLRKISYPGVAVGQSQGQAQAQVADGISNASQNLSGTTLSPPTTATPTTTEDTNAGTGNQSELPDGLGPLKTGSDGADMNIGGQEAPAGLQDITINQGGLSGPTIVFPTGAPLTITTEPPAAQPLPPPPAGQQQAAAAPKTIPASSVTIPGYPYPLSCGPTPANARAQNCIFDIMSYAWLPPPCYDHNLTTDFINLKSRSISLTNSNSKSTSGDKKKGKQTLSTGWRYYQNWSDKTPLDPKTVESGDVEAVYVTWEWHREHCLFMWRKLHRSLLVYGGGGDILGDPAALQQAGAGGGGKGREMMVDGYVGDYSHTEKCGESLRGGDGIDLESVNTMIRMKFPTCGLLTGGKKE